MVIISYLATGEMVEWSITAVLKTAVPRGTGGSNPSLSANKGVNQQVMRFTPFFTPEKLFVEKILYSHRENSRIYLISLCWRFSTTDVVLWSFGLLSKNLLDIMFSSLL